LTVLHRVHFYQDRDYLAERIAVHLGTALFTGGTAILIARPTTMETVEAKLRARGALDAAIAEGRFVQRNAQAMLGLLLGNGEPEQDHFDAVVRPLLARGPRPVHVCSELVDLLWDAQRVDAMLKVEQLWQAACRDTGASVLCGYGLTRLADPAHAGVLDAICS